MAQAGSTLLVDHQPCTHHLFSPSIQIAPEMNRYSLPTIFNDSERPKSGNARVNGSSLVSHSASKQGGTSTTNGDEHHRSISRTVSASAMSTMESPSKTSLTASSSTSSLISGKPLYMPSATRRQRRISLVCDAVYLV